MNHLHGMLRAPRLLAMMPTLACTASCSDCGSGSSPGNKNRLRLRDIIGAIEQAKDLAFANVVFTGGEATIEWKTLLESLGYASSLGLRPRLVTNAHWAQTPDIARKRVQVLVNHGLDNINFSTGDEHVRFVPLSRVINAVVASLDAGLPVHIMVEYRASRSVTKATILQDGAVCSLPEPLRNRLEITESPWMPIDALRVGCYSRTDTVDNSNVAFREGCPSVLRTYALEADGRIAACCGLGISDIPELYVADVSQNNFLQQAVENAESDFLKLWIHAKGPEHILAWASRWDPEIQWQRLYAHNCQACRRLYTDEKVASVIHRHYEEVITDVAESIWFDEVYFADQMAPSTVSDPAILKASISGI